MFIYIRESIKYNYFTDYFEGKGINENLDRFSKTGEFIKVSNGTLRAEQKAV